MKTNLIPWKSLLLAPFAAVPAVTLSGLGGSDAGIATDFSAGLIFGLVMGLPAAFVAMLVVGWPAYLILRYLNLLRLWIVASIGFLVPMIMFAADAPFRTSLAAVAAGVAVSISAYYLRP